ncbi:DUF4976 domain-containing protein [Prolixibacteraceae bacterium JC049]|nr:DUF4976 domain-containing protein [Prolixibacteraceae bacterium JC049]
MKSINLLTAIGMGALALTGCAKKSEPVKQPNIIFIMSDDHSYQTISAYSDKLIKTPNIDRIASGGVIFQNSFVGNSICGPSRATLLTGKHTHINGQINNRVTFDGSQETFPKLLQQAGYQTALVGKWHLRSNPTGFDYWNILPGQGEYYNPHFIEMGQKKRFEGYVTNLTTDFALDWLNGRDKTKPFCLLLHNKAPHRTWMPDTADLKLFADRQFELPDNFFDEYEGRQAAKEQKLSIRESDMDLVYDLKMADKEKEIVTPRPGLANGQRNRLKAMNPAQRKAWDAHYDPIIKDFKDRKLKGKELDEWKYQRYMHDYLGCIKSVDDNVGRVLDYLKANGLDENTIVVYTSDQGFYMGEHGWFDKRFMYEESFRTPLVMKLPKGYNKRGAVKQLVQNIDYAPTFLDLAGVKIPESVQGVSLKPLLKEGKVEKWRDALYYHYYEFPNEHMVKKHYGVRTDRYKLIHFYHDIDTWELFDLEKDPQEMHNLINDKAYAEVKTNLMKKLKELQVQYNDTDRSKY